MGEVYRALDTVLARTVAVKVLAERFSEDSEIRRRFRREARAGARLSGLPYTVTIFDVGEWRNRPFIVMEYLPGGTLAARLADGPAAPRAALTWLEQAALSIDAAHEHEVVHRDIKPANLLLDEHGRVHVADFGIATAAGLDSFTQTGTILGTAGYLSPEQAQGLPAGPASDRYALGVVAFELLTGTRPFAAESPTAEAIAHVSAPVPAASSRVPGVPARADAVLRRALAKEPARRYPRCTAFVADLRAAYTGRDETTPMLLPAAVAERPTVVIHRQRRTPALPVAALVALLVLAGAGLVAAVSMLSGGGSGTPRGVSVPLALTGTVQGTTTTDARTDAAKRSVTASTAHELNTRGYALMLAGNYEGALPLLVRSVRGLDDPADPVTAYANFNLGQTLVRLGRCSSALPYLQRAVQLEPSSAQARDGLQSAEVCANPAPPQGPPPGHRPHGPHGPHGHGPEGPHGDD
jgi:serine/threonine-protein kinase